ncbi:unnamed protein product [Didymodactylos carnosus]|uniref:Uncharacterized protein n=2 Tax=Didymodactylos carnosus TaxID=1234261 RepID=A0A8S2MV97_9BILA|nr:unnamed protein product [Didymodactylos carnosus]CAF3974982.1 unnamed protein product [Didymodactylos carnosus]
MLPQIDVPRSSNSTDPSLNWNMLSEDHWFENELFGYSLCQLVSVIDGKCDIPMLTGFFGSYIRWPPRPIHHVSFLPPIDEDPSSLECAKISLQMTESSLLDTKIQSKTVIVADEKIYTNCLKGSGIDDLLGHLYHGASLRAILNSYF